MTNTIQPSLLLSSVQSERGVKDGSSLGKDEFLEILITQLQNQDPTNPMEDKDFIAQMATFSSLEQMMNLYESFDKFVQKERSSALLDAGQMIGLTVTWLDEAGTEITSLIEAVSYKNGEVKFLTADEKSITQEQIVKVQQGE